MSAILDFRELRDKVLAGEGDEELEPVETPMSSELKSKGTLIGLSIAAATFGGLVFQTVIEEQQEEMESMEAEEKEAEEQAEAENDYQYDYLSAEDSFFHGPSLGMGVGAFGQEGVLYRPKASDQLW